MEKKSSRTKIYLKIVLALCLVLAVLSTVISVILVRRTADITVAIADIGSRVTTLETGTRVSSVADTATEKTATADNGESEDFSEHYTPPAYEFGTRTEEGSIGLEILMDNWPVAQIYNYSDVHNSFFFFEGEDTRTKTNLYDCLEEYMRSSVADVNPKGDGTYKITSYDGRTFTLIFESLEAGKEAVTLLTDNTEGVFVIGRTFLRMAECVEYKNAYCVYLETPNEGEEGED